MNLEDFEKVIVDASRRIWARDGSLWSTTPNDLKSIANRLGWLDCPTAFEPRVDPILEFSAAVTSRFRDVVVLGMGGSSLSVDVFRHVFAPAPGHPKIHVLDSTHPNAIRAIEEQVHLDSTLFVVSSKSGTTLETDTLYRYFWSRYNSAGRTGEHFCAITDPGTPLSKEAEERGFLRLFLNPPDIGGRFSVLSYFGLVPAALLGVDIDGLLKQAQRDAVNSQATTSSNEALLLGHWLGANVAAGRDKLVIQATSEIGAFGYWLEQLIAESTGKHGTGIVPVLLGGKPTQNEPDIATVQINLGAQRAFDINDHHCTITLSSLADLGGEFFRWEFATAVAGMMLGINPFDEPNVAESKERTNRALVAMEQGEPLTSVEPIGDGAQLKEFLHSNVSRNSYLALLGFIDPSPQVAAAMKELGAALESRFSRPVTIGFGPRFLHSTGQLHKGGPSTGVFVQFVDEPAEDIVIPGRTHGFASLIKAQAQGDQESLVEKHRPVARYGLGTNPAKALMQLAELDW